MNKLLKSIVLILFFLQTSCLTLGQNRHYDADLLRLSEILGSLHYLSNLCGLETEIWRDKMSELIDAEKPDDKRRSIFYAAFNDAYRAFAENYRQCTPAAVRAGNLYKKEGEELSQKILDQYSY